MQPYQQATEAIKEHGMLPSKLLKGAALTVGSYGAGSALSRLMPLLSEALPTNLISKAIKKVNPNIGRFLDAAEKNGYGLDDAINFVKEKAGEAQQQEESKAALQPEKGKKKKGNMIAQYSGELAQFIEDHISKGRTPLEAGALARMYPEYEKQIKKIEKDHNANWSDILLSIFGKGKGGIVNDLKAQFQGQYGQQQPQQPIQPQQGMQGQQQMGPGAQALMQAIQQLRQTRGG